MNSSVIGLANRGWGVSPCVLLFWFLNEVHCGRLLIELVSFASELTECLPWWTAVLCLPVIPSCVLFVFSNDWPFIKVRRSDKYVSVKVSFHSANLNIENDDCHRGYQLFMRFGIRSFAVRPDGTQSVYSTVTCYTNIYDFYWQCVVEFSSL